MCASFVVLFWVALVQCTERMLCDEKVSHVCRSFVLSQGDLTQADYNGRTALHQACAEGHLEIVKLLVAQFKVPTKQKDK